MTLICDTCGRHVAEVGGHVVVDLSRVHIIDSTGLGLLVRAHREARERGVTLCLAAPSRFIRTVLHTMRLDGAFPIFDSRDDALAQLSDGGARTPAEGHAVAVPR
ncbi:STAS domain-containing protein [Micromonospora sp. D93]|uniref:STAS domain-containing protein n=1 Tax=Micromonospora sp. D93 TaxID=2824886 RepID=UPI0035A8D80A